MRVVKIVAGLGNQLFDYAFYRKVEKLYGDCYVDLGWFDYKERFAWYPYQLENLGLKAKVIDRADYCVKDFWMQRNSWSEKQFSDQIKNINLPILSLVNERNPYACDRLWEIDNAYYMGCFQNIDNIDTELETIVKEIKFPMQDSARYIELKKQIMQTNSVAVHIRFDDYSSIENFEKVCPISYYREAMRIISEKISAPMFFIFSNKIEKAKEIFCNDSNICFVDINDRFNGIGDMELMSLCKHAVIPNSTFGWWSAVIGDYGKKDRIVITPNIFDTRFEEVKPEDVNLWFDRWIRL